MKNIKLKTKRVYPDRTKFRESREIQWESVWICCISKWHTYPIIPLCRVWEQPLPLNHPGVWSWRDCGHPPISSAWGQEQQKKRKGVNI